MRTYAKRFNELLNRLGLAGHLLIVLGPAVLAWVVSAPAIVVPVVLYYLGWYIYLVKEGYGWSTVVLIIFSLLFGFALIAG